MNLAEFRRRNQAQFNRAEDWLRSVAVNFIIAAATDVVKRTPGFDIPGYGGQLPEDTQYIPTGRLRGGWNLVTTATAGEITKGLDATRGQAGPFSAYGAETIERITAQAAAHFGAFGKLYLENDVAYAHLVRTGGGNHAGRIRDWPLETAVRMGEFHQQALSRAAGR